MTTDYIRNLIRLLETIEGLPSPEDVEAGQRAKDIQKWLRRNTDKLPQIFRYLEHIVVIDTDHEIELEFVIPMVEYRLYLYVFCRKVRDKFAYSVETFKAREGELAGLPDTITKEWLLKQGDKLGVALGIPPINDLITAIGAKRWIYSSHQAVDALRIQMANLEIIWDALLNKDVSSSDMTRQLKKSAITQDKG